MATSAALENASRARPRRRTDEKGHGTAACGNSDQSVGLLTRQLHDTLAELGFDRQLQEAAAGALPDARQRLAYVVTLTEQAASRSLNAVEIATPVQEKLAADAVVLAANWDSIFRGESDVGQLGKSPKPRAITSPVPQRTETSASILRNPLSQAFQDSGQVLNASPLRTPSPCSLS